MIWLNPRERERLPRVPGFSEWGESRQWKPERRGRRLPLIFFFLINFSFFFWYEKRKKKLVGGDGGHIRFHRPSQIVWKKKEEKKTNYNRNSKLKACKIADLETWISTLVHKVQINQKKITEKRKRRKILCTCMQVERGKDGRRLQFTASVTISLMNQFLEEIQLWTRKPSDLRVKHSRRDSEKRF